MNILPQIADWDECDRCGCYRWQHRDGYAECLLKADRLLPRCDCPRFRGSHEAHLSPLTGPAVG